MGPTSHAALLAADSAKDQDAAIFGRQTSVDSEDRDSDSEYCIQYPLTKSMRFQMVTEVLKSLRHIKMIHHLVHRYFKLWSVRYIAAPMGVDMIDALKKTVEQYNLTKSPADPRTVSRILKNTAQPLHIPPTMSAKDFHTLCTGENLRLELIGFLLAIAGTARDFGLRSDRPYDDRDSSTKSQFIEEMVRSSTSCLIISQLISPVNDVSIWMIYENLLVTSISCGYTSKLLSYRDLRNLWSLTYLDPTTWRRLGETASQMYLLGMHRESKSTDLPTFILETRRKLFGTAYNRDKTISTFLGRPPTLSKRHTDIKLPLDISDEDLCAGGDTLDQAIASLDEHGWNTQRQYPNSCWIRMRLLSSYFREEILDFALTKVDSCVEKQLLKISRRNRETWESHPQHMRYWASSWNEDMPAEVCFMLVNVYLTHFYNEFMIQKLLDHHTVTSHEPLLRVSMDLLTAALSCGSLRDRRYDIQRDLSYVIIIYGIPTGSVLATALQEEHQTGLSLPPSISRSEIVRNLSVLISHLDQSAQMYRGRRMSNWSWNLCRRAAKTFTKVIDSVIDPRPNLAGPASVEELGLDLDFFSGPGLDGFEGMDLLDGSGLGEGIDWGNAGQWTF